ncbi:MAG: hypothetical protein WD971_05480, partial [Pirellulales bacterium]
SMPISAQEVWSGLTKSFTRPDDVDGTLPENQDTLVPGVIFARGSSGGLYNAISEPDFVRTISPEFTEWATDLLPANAGQPIAATNWANLTFGVFTDAYGGAVSFNFDRVAVVRLVNEDIYFDLRITSWTDGHTSSSPGFTYLRAEPPAAEPTGDYNGDHIVDAADYTIWRDTLGSTTDLRANGDNTGESEDKIDDADYVFWKAHFGDLVPLGAGGGQVATVPEPTMLVLVLIGLINLLMMRISPRARASC